MAKLKLGALEDDKPVRVSFELPAEVHRDLIAYAASNTGGVTFQLQSIIIDAVNPEQDPQTRLHADTFHPTAKAWLFLDDVADDQGPFSYVPGSHRLTPERLAWEYRQSLDARRSPERMHREGSLRIDESELASLGLPPARRFAVPAVRVGLPSDDVGDPVEHPGGLDDVGAELGHPTSFDRGDDECRATGNGIGERELPDVMQQRRVFEVGYLALGQAHLAPDRHRERTHPVRVAGLDITADLRHP